MPHPALRRGLYPAGSEPGGRPRVPVRGHLLADLGRLLPCPSFTRGTVDSSFTRHTRIIIRLGPDSTPGWVLEFQSPECRVVCRGVVLTSRALPPPPRRSRAWNRLRAYGSLSRTVSRPRACWRRAWPAKI